ncbi:MAG: glutamine-hydrolyzing GMP synthase [Phycisphaerales bacterium]
MSGAIPSTAYDADEVILVVDFGSQTAQLIARRLRDAGVLAFLVSPDITAKEIERIAPKGLVFSGGPASVYEIDAPRFDPDILKLGIPILGICYGLQVIANTLGVPVEHADHREFGRATFSTADHDDLFRALPDETVVWMSHGDQLSANQDVFRVVGSTPTCPLAAVRHATKPIVGLQFHPEVSHTAHGSDILANFAFTMCDCHGTWRMIDVMEHQVDLIRERTQGARVVCGLSGGVDSSVVAALLSRAIGDRLTCVFVDHGLLRKNERALVEAVFRDHFDAELRVVDAEAKFMMDLAGVTDPQEKRRRIGHRFIETFKTATADLDDAEFLAQGTLYPDVIESGGGHAGKAASIKLHHNVGGLPEQLGFELIEPLRDLFKDEVRRLGEVLGLPEQMVWRHPFPGPGLAVRILGEVTKDKCDLLRNCDEIVLEELTSADLYRATSQVFAVLLPVQSVGVMGDGRTYESCVAIRAVTTTDFMTADWARLPYDVLARMSSRIINEVRGVNRVVYDISSKPPATIEWE